MYFLTTIMTKKENILFIATFLLADYVIGYVQENHRKLNGR